MALLTNNVLCWRRVKVKEKDKWTTEDAAVEGIICVFNCGKIMSFSLKNLTVLDSREYIQQAAVPRRWATHGGEDVPVYATGAGATVFSGLLDQTFIPFGIAYAACMGPMRRLCEEHRQQSGSDYSRQCETNAGAAAAAAVSSRSISTADHEDHDENSAVRGMKRIHSAAPVGDIEQQQQTGGTSLLDFIRYHWELSSVSSSSPGIPSQTLIVTLIVHLCTHLLATWCWSSSLYLLCT